MVQGPSFRKVKVAAAANFIFHLQQAVKKGAPHAQQVADRWHLLANLRETIMALLKRKRTSLPTEPVEQADPFSEEPQADLSQETEVW